MQINSGFVLFASVNLRFDAWRHEGCQGLFVFVQFHSDIAVHHSIPAFTSYRKSEENKYSSPQRLVGREQLLAKILKALTTYVCDQVFVS